MMWGSRRLMTSKVRDAPAPEMISASSPARSPRCAARREEACSENGVTPDLDKTRSRPSMTETMARYPFHLRRTVRGRPTPARTTSSRLAGPGVWPTLKNLS